MALRMLNGSDFAGDCTPHVGFEESHVLGLAALASLDGGQAPKPRNPLLTVIGRPYPA